MPIRLMQIILPENISKNEIPSLLEEKKLSPVGHQTILIAKQYYIC